MLTVVLVMTAAFMVVEFAGGLFTNSLALLADAGHMLTDVAALSLSLLAAWFAMRPPNARKSFGYHRTEILAAVANGVAIVVIAVMIVIEAIERLQAPQEVKTVPMLAVATIGLLVNLTAVYLLHKEKDGSLNIQGAFLHIVGDLLGSVGAILAGIIMLTTGAYWVDPLVSFLVASLIVYSASKLLRRSVDVLLEGTPPHLDLDQIKAALKAVEGVADVHDLHVWTITSGFDSLTAHLVLAPGATHQQVLAESHEMLTTRFGLDHSTLQPEQSGLLPCGDPARAQAARADAAD